MKIVERENERHPTERRYDAGRMVFSLRRRANGRWQLARDRQLSWSGPHDITLLNMPPSVEGWPAAEKLAFPAMEQYVREERRRKRGNLIQA